MLQLHGWLMLVAWALLAIFGVPQTDAVGSGSNGLAWRLALGLGWQRLLGDLIASTQHAEPESPRTPRRRAEPRRPAELPLFPPSLALHADVLSWARPGAGNPCAGR